MTVNASVISAGELWRRGAGEISSVYKLLRSRMPVLIATAGTTIAGSLPFLFLREGNNVFVKTLALITVLGVGTSFLCSLTLVPSLMYLYLKTCFGRKHKIDVPRSRDRKSSCGVP
jgi:multidrug efflux pump subunit AcrB